MSDYQSKLLIINSKDRISGSINQFHVNIHNNHLHSVKKIVLINASTINSEYNINTKNNTLYCREDAVAYADITLPVGIYNSDDLITAMNLLLPTGVVMSFSTGTDNRFIFTTDGVTTFDMDYSNSRMSDVLGLTDSILIPISTAQPMQAIPNLVGLQTVHIRTHAIAQSNSIVSDNSQQSIISSFSVPVECGFGSALLYHNENHSSDHMTYVGTNNLNNIDISILDQNLQLCELQKDISLTFKIYF